MHKLKITAQLASPLIKQGEMTFDALLMCLKGDPDIPLKQTDGLFHASSAILETPIHGTVGFVAGLHARHRLDSDLIKKDKHGKTHKKYDTTRRKGGGNVFHTYPTFTTATVSWHCEGDMHGIHDLLKGVYFLGKKRAQGYGQLVEGGWSISESDFDGIMDDQGNPLRPVPENRFAGNRDLPLVDAAWRPRYYEPMNRAACFMPMENAA